MREFNPEQHRIETASVLEFLDEVMREGSALERYAAYVGLDMH
jgi:hypothetical protein